MGAESMGTTQQQHHSQRHPAIEWTGDVWSRQRDARSALRQLPAKENMQERRYLCLRGSGLSAGRANVDSLNNDRGRRRLGHGHPLWGACAGLAARLR